MRRWRKLPQESGAFIDGAGVKLDGDVVMRWGCELETRMRWWELSFTTGYWRGISCVCLES